MLKNFDLNKGPFSEPCLKYFRFYLHIHIIKQHFLKKKKKKKMASINEKPDDMVAMENKSVSVTSNGTLTSKRNLQMFIN